MNTLAARCLALISVVVLAFTVVGSAQALGPAPSWQLTQGPAGSTCVQNGGISMPGVEINVPVGVGPSSEQGVLSAPGFPNLGYTTDSSFTGVGTFSFFVFVPAAYSLPANTPLTLSVTTYFGPSFTGGAAYVSTATWDCTTGAVTSLTNVVPGAAAPAGDVFSGPGLPGSDARNLVLFNVDTAVLNEADGLPTDRVIRACQTGFVTATSTSGDYYQIFVMGGWVPAANTQDVPEAYGQPGYPVAPNCVGK